MIEFTDNIYIGKAKPDAGGEINNQDLTITQNGIYTASPEYTGLGTVTVDVPSSGDIVTAINKTDVDINVDDKVWLNENIQTAGTSYIVDDKGSIDHYIVMNRVGTKAYCTNKLYSIGAEKATVIGTTADSYISAGCSIKYVGNGNTIVYSFPTQNFNLDNGTVLDNLFTLGGNFISHTNEAPFSTYGIAEYDFDRSEIVQDYLVTSGSNFFMWQQVKIGDYIYQLNKSSPYKYKLDISSGTAVKQDNFTFTNGEVIYPLSTTTDFKYILASTTQGASAHNTSNGYFRMLEVVSENEIKVLSSLEVPAEMAAYYTTGCYVVFNPYTGILTLTARSSTSNIQIFKYSNGNWEKLSLNIGDMQGGARSGIDLSDDMSRCVYTTAEGSYFTAYVRNLTNVSGYAAVPFKPYTVNNQTLTGVAEYSAGPEAKVQVKTVLV